MTKNLYQTVDDRNNADEVENHGPYFCKDKSAWLGSGYYFWDSEIEVGKWWGRKHYSNNYIVCKSTISNDEDIFDLYNRHEDRASFNECVKAINTENNVSNIKVSEVIEYLKDHTDILKRYKGIRALAIGCTSLYNYRFTFANGNRAYLDTCPAIQYCIIDKTILNGYEIVYPNFYCTI